MEDKELLDNSKSYWNLVNAIAELCDNFIEAHNLYADDVISALDRVKMDWLEQHIKCSLCDENEEHENDIPDKI